MATMTTTPTPATQQTTRHRAATFEEQQALDRELAFRSARACARDLATAAEGDDLEALAHTAYLTICHLARDFTKWGTVAALTRWRRIDRKRIDRIVSLGESLRRDRPSPSTPAAVWADGTRRPFFDREMQEWSWHDKEDFGLYIVGMLELPDAVARLEALPVALKEEAGPMHHWMVETARWFHDPRPLEERGDFPRAPHDEEPAPQ